MKFNAKNNWFILTGCLLLLACIAAGLVILVGYLMLTDPQQTPVAEVELAPTAVVPATATSTRFPLNETKTNKIQPTATLADPSPTPTATVTPTPEPMLLVNLPKAIDQRPLPPRAGQDLDALFNGFYPAHDYFEAAERVGWLDLGARTVQKPPYQIGEQEIFYIDDETTVQATLLAATGHIYYWVENGLEVDTAELEQAAQRLEEEYYPLVISLFGQVWQPGVDNDPRFAILHLNDSGETDELGFFTDLDEYPRTLYPDSNEQEIIYLNMSQLEVGSDLYFGTLVHEIQHLIQWHNDPNETAWMNEGLSQLSELYVGLDTVDFTDYVARPETRLDTWETDEALIDAHYGAAYLYMVYVWEQLGETAVRELARNPAGGMVAMRQLLEGYAPLRSLEQFSADWAVANYLDDLAAGTIYAYQHLQVERPLATERLTQPDYETIGTLDQFGIHYIDLDYSGPITVTFAGDTTAPLLDTPRPNDLFWFAPDMVEVNAQLTAAFDLSQVQLATLAFDAWYDLEEEWDYAYVTLSADGGTTWEQLEPVHSIEAIYGMGFNGRSASEFDARDGWVHESIPIDAYAGQMVLIRFELFTDASGFSGGFAVDNMAIPELGYQTAVDQADGWQSLGFVQTNWLLPQQWSIQLIQNGPVPQVIPLPLNPFNQGQWPLNLGPEGGTLVIMPLTPFVSDPANYWLTIK